MPDIRSQLTRVREAANGIAETASDKLRDTTEKAREGAGDLMHTGRARANDAKDKVGAAYSDARDRTQRVATRANEIVQEHPIVAVAGAVAAGAVLAWMFPKGRAAIKALPGLAVTAGGQIVEAALAARAATAESAESLKDSASNTLQVAKAKADDAVASVRDTAAAADVSGRTSRLAEEFVALLTDKIDAASKAWKARLPKS